MQPIVIAVCGRRRSGKDAIASYLCEKHGFVNMKFAKYLKGMLREAFGFTDDELEGSLKDSIHSAYGVTPRRLMQFMGTDVMQFGLQGVIPGIGRNFWALRLSQDLNAHVTNLAAQQVQPRVVISDMRFMHEWDTIRRQCADRGFKFMTIRLTRPTTQSSADDASDAHASEREWEAIPYGCLIHNSGTLESLCHAVDDAVLDFIASK